MSLAGGPWAWPWLLLLALLSSGSLGRSPPSCPPSSPCFCFWAPDTVQCRFVRLEGPPESVPGAAEGLSIVGARLSGLSRAAFAGGWLPGRGPRRPLANLTLLLLSHDGLERLEEGAFAGLPSLATLDLSHNPLRAIHPSAFGLGCCRRLATLRLNQALLGGSEAEALLDGALLNLSSLARLELRGNGLRDPPPAWSLPPALEELDLRNNSIAAWEAERLDGLLLALPRLRLQVAPNPSQCDCPSLRPLLAWHRNASWRTPDAPELRCASPARLKESPLRRLRPLQLGCRQQEAADWGLLQPQPPGAQEPELETASYVFFGIVLALIGVVFLMVLYLNRRGIKRWLNNLREACRDQMEGYHYRYEQDSDPRRASPGGL